MSEGLFFRQLLAGRDFAAENELAVAMRNFTYLVGDLESGATLVVDPAYDVAALRAIIERDGRHLVGAVATHYHPDHVGGTMMGHSINGIAQLASEGVALHANRYEVPWLVERAGVREEDLVAHDDRDVLTVGGVALTLLHTPGHTPGSQCLLVEGRLLSGDTLFLDGCGRTDLPGGDGVALSRTLRVRLSEVGDDVELYPGHLYSPEASLSMGAVRARNPVFSMDLS